MSVEEPSSSSSSQICPLVCSGHPREQPHSLASLLLALWCPQNLPRVGHFSYPLFPSPSLEDRASRPAHFLVKNPLRCSAKCMVRNSGVLRTHRSASGHFLGFCFCLWSCAGKAFSPFHMSKTRYLVFEPGHSLDTFYQRLLLVIFVDKLCLSLSLTDIQPRPGHHFVGVSGSGRGTPGMPEGLSSPGQLLESALASKSFTLPAGQETDRKQKS